METRLLPLLPEGWREELRYLTGDEFSNRARDPVTGTVIAGLTLSEMNSDYNRDAWNTVDGEVIDACDKLAAMTEAAISIRFGVRPPALEHGRESIYESYKDCVIGPVDFGKLFSSFL